MWLGFRVAASIRFGFGLFPVFVDRTGQAELPHPALGKGLTIAAQGRARRWLSVGLLICVAQLVGLDVESNSVHGHSLQRQSARCRAENTCGDAGSVFTM